jgi:hypothetical protein
VTICWDWRWAFAQIADYECLVEAGAPVDHDRQRSMADQLAVARAGARSRSRPVTSCGEEKSRPGAPRFIQDLGG